MTGETNAAAVDRAPAPPGRHDRSNVGLRLLVAGAALAVLGIVFVAFLASDPLDEFTAAPPEAALATERVVFEPDLIRIDVRNDGVQELTVGQVTVNDAYRQHTIGDRRLARFEATELRIPYPWEDGVPLDVGIVTANGDVVPLDVGVGALTPVADGSTWATYTWIGVLIGVLPVAAGLCCFPVLGLAGTRVLDFVLALTVGLLAFLLVDTILEGWEMAARAPGSFRGRELLVLATVLMTTALVVTERRTADRRAERAGASAATPVALGIGLHNLGEGLAVGAALAAGRVDLGAALVVGFALHNVTEGVAIAAPLASGVSRAAPIRLVGLVALAGAPAIVGLWIGGFAFDPTLATLAFGVAAGALAPVLWTVGRFVLRSSTADLPVAAGFALGLAAMYLTGLLAV